MKVKNYCLLLILTLFMNGTLFAQNEFAPDSIINIMHRVAKFRMVTADTLDNGWGEGATFFPGVMAVYERTKEKRYLDSAVSWGKQFSWKPYETDLTTNGDNQCCFQTYTEIYLVDSLSTNNFMIQPADNNITNMFDKAPLTSRRWGWCDLMFMAPPAIVRLAKATHKPRYIDSMNVYWWNSSAVYYDATNHLYWRDLNHKDTCWSRGNGWVFGGLARVIPWLPANYSSRSKYITQFQEMAAKLKAVQQSDGLWRSDLLNPNLYTAKETSGTAFFCFGMAWGINYGILDKTDYEPTVRKAWTALVQLLNPNGTLSWVQGVAHAPGNATQASSRPFAEGAMLLAAEEMYKLVGQVPTVDRKVSAVSRFKADLQPMVIQAGLRSIKIPAGATGYQLYTLQGRMVGARRSISPAATYDVYCASPELGDGSYIINFLTR